MYSGTIVWSQECHLIPWCQKGTVSYFSDLGWESSKWGRWKSLKVAEFLLILFPSSLFALTSVEMVFFVMRRVSQLPSWEAPSSLLFCEHYSPFPQTVTLSSSCFLLALSIANNILFCCLWHFEPQLTVPSIGFFFRFTPGFIYLFPKV